LHENVGAFHSASVKRNTFLACLPYVAGDKCLEKDIWWNFPVIEMKTSDTGALVSIKP